MKRLLLAFSTVVAVAAAARADSALVFNEIMYHPATNEPGMEWVEFHNQLAVDLDVSGWSVSGGIDYTFPNGSVIRGRGYVVLAIDPVVLTTLTGVTNVFGPFAGRLGNNGESLELRNNSQRLVDAVNYEVDGNWPVGPDGSGVSLSKRDRNTASAPPENWTVSAEIGGTPGADNFPLVGVALPELTLISQESAWKYEASGQDPGTSWRTLAYNDGAWGSGNAWLYHGAITATRSRALTNIFSTGIGTNGNALSQGARDPHYQIIVAAQGPINTNAIVMLNHSAWMANDSSSTWIGVIDNGANNIAQGNYTYRTTFDTAGFAIGTVQIQVNVAADDRCNDVLLNGISTGISFVGFNAFSPTFTLSNGIVAGVNTLEFRTANDGTAANPGGFRAQLRGSGQVTPTNTALPPGANTYYFRKTFNHAGQAGPTALRLNAIIDDGAVFYLNGVELHRINMPGGTITHSTPAASDVANPAFTGPIFLSGALHNGQNVLAVEVHQASGGGGDLLFDAELVATPQPPEPLRVAFNEHAPAGPDFFVELINYGTNDIDIDEMRIVRDSATDAIWTLPAITLNSGEFLTISNAAAQGDKLYLFDGDTQLDAIVIGDRLRGRSPAGNGRWQFPNAPTPGGANSFAFRNEIVINEIMYNHQLLPPTNNLPGRPSDEEWVELYNRSGAAVDLSGWEIGGGIEYLFGPGTSIPAGGYLVIADNAAALRFSYPGLPAIGDFGGRLSGQSDRITLRDAFGNVADEVRYFDGGRWPEYADGGGSSLELRDPNADNTKAEAWAASDESRKTMWQTYTYQMTANIPAGSGQPTQWNDFILGLQSGGECLIDDITVVDVTGGNAAMIDNGDFENGLSGWRVLGTHNRSSVVTDPTNPGNRVLHVIATGPQEHMHNHIERTYIPGRTVANGRDYRVTFRARWLAGNNLLNTRLYFNRAARTTALPTPPLNGTPGAANSRSVANIGPTFSGFSHSPSIPQPGAPVTVSVTAADPNGIAAAQVWWSVNDGPWNNAAMTAQGNGLYHGTIPGQSAGVVQFYVRAVDGLGAAATFPARGPDSGALYAIADGQANLALAHNVRVILSASNINFLHGVAQDVNQTNVMSNDLLPCTVIYDEHRAYYDMGVHLRGSQRGRYSDVRTGYHLTFQPDDPFLGVHPVMLVDRSGAGDATANQQEEIVLKHIMNRAGGLPGSYSQICRLIGARTRFTGPAQFFPRHEDLFIETAFENGGDGTMFEMELIYYPTTANAAGYKLPRPDTVVGTDLTNLGDDKEIYRYNFMIKNHRDTDDYSRFIAMCKALSLTGPAQDIAARQVMDVDQWLRGYAMVSLGQVGDMYTFGNNHNFFMYERPGDRKIMYFPWDMDFVFSGGTGRALVGDQNLGRLVNLPGNLRCLYAHMLDIISVSFNPAYMAYWTDHYDNFAPGQNYSTTLNNIGARMAFVQGQLTAATNAAFAVNGPTAITTGNTLATFTGTAPVTMKTIRVNGREYPITWTSTTAWRLAIPVSEATTVLEFIGHDLRGRGQSNLARSVTVNYTGPAPDPAGAIVINEIMYHPQTRDTAFIELYNRSEFSFDLSDWRFNGLSYTFPKGSIMTNGQYLVLANQVSAYAAAFGSSAPAAFDEFGGNLQNGGETLTLLRPGAQPGEEIVVDKVKYDDAAPWPPNADGHGASLQLVDGGEDNARVSNWSDGGGWRYVTYTGTIQGPPLTPGTNFFIYMLSAGEVFIDDMKLVVGTVPEAGPNLLINGDFESPLAGSWQVNGNHGNSVQSTTISHSGSGSLKLSSSATGSTSGHNLRQFIPSPASNTVCTLSLWLLPSSDGDRFVVRTAPGSQFWTTNNFRPILSTPGTANTVASDRPPYPDLWLNEVQPENATGPVDNRGEREPWIEIYNSGAATINLEGCYLANNYSNIMQWAFPPGSSIGPGQFKVIFADAEPGESTATEWHANFRPLPVAGAISLAWTAGEAVEVLDYFNYEEVRANWSYGSYPDGQVFDRQVFYRPTLNNTNDNTPPPITVFINEWMASNTRTILNTNNNNRFDDWFELYNPTASSADLTGYYLTDNLNNRFQFPIPPGYVVPPHGFLLVWADNEPQLNNTNDAALHTSFRLERGGESIGLTAPDGSFIDSVTFEPQFTDISQGRFADGSANIYFLRAATPRAPNSTWTNRYPVLSPIAEQTALVNDSFTYTASATDPDGDALGFSLDPGAPAGATIDANSGEFSWTPPSPGTNTVVIRVTDNAPLPLSAARSFRIIAVNGIRIGSITRPSANQLSINMAATAGKTYRAEYKNALSDANWIPIPPGVAASGPTVSIVITIGEEPQRFFRVVQVD